MVKKILLLLCVTGLSACSFVKSVWNAVPPIHPLVRISPPPAPPVTALFSDDDSVSIAAMRAWKSLILDAFNKIQGRVPNLLSFSEIRLLVESGFVRIGESPANSADRVISLLEFLGFRDRVTGEGVAAILDWFERHRVQARSLYHLLNDPASSSRHLSAAELLELIDFAGSVFELRGGAPVSQEEWTRWLRPWIPGTCPHAKAALQEETALLVALSATLCGEHHSLGRCAHEFAGSFKEAIPAIEFVLGRASRASPPEETARAAKLLAIRAREWFENHPSLPVGKITDLAAALGVPPPEPAERLFDWVPVLNPAGEKTAISAEIPVKIAAIASDAILKTLDSPSEQARSHLPLRSNLYSGTSDWLIAITSRPKQEERLIRLGIQLLDTATFLENILAQLRELPVDESSAERSLEPHPVGALATLLRIGSEILPERKAPVFAIDTAGLAAWFEVYDELRSLNPRALLDCGVAFRESPRGKFLKRRTVMECLPRMIKEGFPRTYQECVGRGFERTCGVVFDEILPNPDPGSIELELHDADIIPFAGLLFERIYRHCDSDKSGTLDAGGFRTSEKRCVVDLGVRIAEALMEAGFVKSSGKARRLLGWIRRPGPASRIAESALARGTLEGIPWYRQIGSVFERMPASPGSVLSLLAEIMNADKTRAIEADQTGPVDSPGTELLYHREMSRRFLPPLEWHARRDSNTGPSH